ncbi:hypothetical protein AMC82_CH01093 [Rhizobium phaseoli]|uniref:hypothetical protein n=1 Tax=Rhizobium phaseoli TaxID=396 RepID=UPI0007E9303C|nr:hypothetical protein [Rhizobium phaseoli]ANL64786.1 hypothetical protein AMC84_CH01096 [Rhizobium phaseoli]ANL77600.1 hypothetical protein AMC82_CH01093 [Rhizobium phaseoli]
MTDIEEDQRRRRASEIRSASLAYVRACGRRGELIDLSEFALRRWPCDGVVKHEIMTQALVDDVRGGVPVVDVWRRFELPGRIALHLTGAPGYQALYDILERNSLSPGFTPRQIARWVSEGSLAVERAAEILGVDPIEIKDLVTKSHDRNT